MDDIDVIVVGAGAVGCSTASHLAKAGRRVVVLPDNDAVGQAHAQDVLRWLNP